jgi:hypothetical protein
LGSPLGPHRPELGLGQFPTDPLDGRFIGHQMLLPGVTRRYPSVRLDAPLL